LLCIQSHLKSPFGITDNLLETFLGKGSAKAGFEEFFEGNGFVLSFLVRLEFVTTAFWRMRAQTGVSNNVQTQALYHDQ